MLIKIEECIILNVNGTIISIKGVTMVVKIRAGSKPMPQRNGSSFYSKLLWISEEFRSGRFCDSVLVLHKKHES